MVSFWPWRGEDSSPEGFEKALSALAIKVTDAQTHLDLTRSKSRRVRVLSSLYLGFAYAVYTVVVMLVVGYQKMGIWEWAGMVGGPMVIIMIRKAIRAFFDYRIDALENRVNNYQEERAKTIQKLKDATKYDSTLQLLQKYGEPERRPAAEHEARHRRDESHERPRTPAPMPSRTGLPPPPTANIQRPTTPQSRPSSAAGPAPESAHAHAHARPQIPQLHVHQPPESAADLVSNPLLAQAVMPPVGPRQFEPAAPHWYDRILDLLMGEDETSAKNRIVLICWKCRLVNGQAPPGTKRLSDIGHWRCKECKATNGEADEGKKIVSEVLKAGERGSKSRQKDVQGRGPSADSDADADGDGDSDMVRVAKEDVVGADEADLESKADGLRKRKGKGKN